MAEKGYEENSKELEEKIRELEDEARSMKREISSLRQAGRPDAEEQKFFEALCALREEESFVHLPVGVRWMGSRDFGRSMFVRRSYKELFLKISEKTEKGEGSLGGHDFIVTGTPGIGKSFFALYWLFKRVQQRRPVLLEFGEGAHNCYLWRPEEEVIVGTRDDFRGNLKDENMLYLSDARKDIRFIHNCQTILFSSPRESNFHDFLKSGAEIYFMPLWTREELELLRDPVYGDRVSSSRVDMISAVYGPTPRYTLQIAAKQSDFGNWSDEELRNRNIVSRGGDRLGQALSSANISLYFAFEGYETGNYSNEFSFLLLHMDTTDFSIPRLRWASTYVWDKLMERHTKEMLYFAHTLVFGASKERKLGSLAGHTFENLMQDAVRCGCASASREIKALSTVGGRSDPPLPNRRLPRLEYKTLKEFQKMEEYVYYQSDRPNEPAVDSFVVMKKELVLFQFTVAEVHPVDAKGLEDVISKVISCLGALDKISLVFVLPKYRYDEWKSPQRIVSGKKQLKNLSKYLRRVVQYALQVQEEATRNAFPEVPPNPYSLGKRGRTHC